VCNCCRFQFRSFVFFRMNCYSPVVSGTFWRSPGRPFREITRLQTSHSMPERRAPWTMLRDSGCRGKRCCRSFAESQPRYDGAYAMDTVIEPCLNPPPGRRRQANDAAIANSTCQSIARRACSIRQQRVTIISAAATIAALNIVICPNASGPGGTQPTCRRRRRRPSGPRGLPRRGRWPRGGPRPRTAAPGARSE